MNATTNTGKILYSRSIQHHALCVAHIELERARREGFRLSTSVYYDVAKVDYDIVSRDCDTLTDEQFKAKYLPIYPYFTIKS